MDLRNAISSRFGLAVAPTLAFDFPTLRALSQHIAMRTEPPLQAADPGLDAGLLGGGTECLRSLVLAVGCKYPENSEGGASLGALNAVASWLAGQAVAC